MELERALNCLASNTETIAALTRSITEMQARWKPSPADWSVLEVICHLYDEEREDFRQRLDYTLHRSGDEWPPIDPQGWVTARSYNQRDLATMLDSLMSERQASIQWLRDLNHANWATARQHPAGGQVTAADMLAAWVAHDHLHIRQLNELHWQYLALTASPFSLDYAGGW